MPRKDIYRIDNYFIAIGWVFLIVGVALMALDPFLWNEISIREKQPQAQSQSGRSTYAFEDRDGRTLEQIRQEKGPGYVVTERTFPLGRTLLVINGIALLVIGYGYRSREKKIISLWHALEHAGEAGVQGLTVSLGLSREFILRHLKDINAQQQSAYTYDVRSDKIIHNRFMSEFLLMADCENCGHKINQKVSLDLSNPPRCHYCGTGISADHLNKLKHDVLMSMQQKPAVAAPTAMVNAGDFNIVLFVILLLFFWPAAVFYVIKKKSFS